MLVMGWDPLHSLHMGDGDSNTAPGYNLSPLCTYCKGDPPSPCPPHLCYSLYCGWNKGQPQITLSFLKEDKISPLTAAVIQVQSYLSADQILCRCSQQSSAGSNGAVQIYTCKRPTSCTQIISRPAATWLDLWDRPQLIQII